MRSTLKEDHGRIIGNLRKFGANLARAETASLKRIANEILEDSQDNYVPVLLGDLRDSGHVEVSPKGQSVSVVFDDWKAPIIHEHLSAMSPPSWVTAEESGSGIHWTKAGTGPKFLEKPWLKKANDYLEELGEDLQVEKVGLR